MLNNIAINDILNEQLNQQENHYHCYFKRKKHICDQEEYLPKLPTISKPQVKNSAYLKMYLSKGERGGNLEKAS